MSKLCLTITETSLESVYNTIKNNFDNIDLVELRVDFLDISEQCKIDTFKCNKPVILTFRKKIDGGLYCGDESYREKILIQGIKSGNFSYVDLEEDLHSTDIDKAVLSSGIRVIRSFHDFNGVPQNLADRIKNIIRNSNEIPKAAVMINGTNELLTFYKEVEKLGFITKIVLGMGSYGFNTRILAERIGSYLTFCSKEGSSAAPGHVSPQLLNDIYRFRKIERNWKIMGIIGNPVMHTKSPLIHNRGYKELDLNAVYVPFETNNLEQFMEICKLLNIEGFSVTVPFKNDIIPLLDGVTESVKQIGACNTVTRVGDKWIGDNSDYVGFINPLLQAYGSIQDKQISVIGAGGAAKAAVFALKSHGAKVVILNRTLKNAEVLAKDFNTDCAELSIDSIDTLNRFSDIIVQTTNVGMHPLESINPLDFYTFSGNEFVYDIIYSPEKTILLDKAEKAGCRILNGWKMLEEQAYRQFKLFTGLEYPLK
ncbi:MAG: shikimate dehydrogenase [Spirochaetales bacterium]|nr:shikimate dehydrogenase [Spirochaetales bacterium]